MLADTVNAVRRALAVAFLSVLLLLSGCGHGEKTAAPPPTTEPVAEPTQPTSPPEPLPPPPSARAMSWSSAGAFVWNEANISPEALGEELAGAGFGWVVLRVHDGLVEDPVDGDWVRRFRRVSGLPVGGWGVLRDHPRLEAALADALVARHGLDFYVANAEAEYAYSGPDGASDQRFGRSHAFVDTFRRLQPGLPAGLSSYCRPVDHDLDWGTWRNAGFGFLPQAYVNDFGSAAAPTACAAAARPFFGTAVHPTIGTYPGSRSTLPPERYARLLARAGTVGFSVYLAETEMTVDEWRVLGESIGPDGIALAPGS